MNEKDELGKIMDEVDSVSGEDTTNDVEEDIGTAAIEEAVDSSLSDNNNPESQSERLERLYQEGELTDEEFELLRTELVESNQNREPVDWLPEDTLNKAIGMYREGIEESDPYSDPTPSMVFEIAALPSDASVSVVLYDHGGQPTVLLGLTEQDDEERLQECIEQYAPYELRQEISSGSAWIKLNVIPSGYDGQVSDEDLITEINHLFQVITHTYGLTMSELSKGSIIVEPQ